MDNNYGTDNKIGDGSKKTFKSVMAMWCEDTMVNSKTGGPMMMKRTGDLKVGIHPIGDVVDTVQIGKTVSSKKRHWDVVKIAILRVKKKRKMMEMTLMWTIERLHCCL